MNQALTGHTAVCGGLACVFVRVCVRAWRHPWLQAEAALPLVEPEEMEALVRAPTLFSSRCCRRLGLQRNPSAKLLPCLPVSCAPRKKARKHS